MTCSEASQQLLLKITPLLQPSPANDEQLFHLLHIIRSEVEREIVNTTNRLSTTAAAAAPAQLSENPKFFNTVTKRQRVGRPRKTVEFSSPLILPKDLTMAEKVATSSGKFILF